MKNFKDITVKDLEEMIGTSSIIKVETEGRWIVITISNGIRFKIKDWKTS